MKSRLTLQQVEWALQLIKKLSEDADYKPTKTHLTLLARYKEENPRNYPAFFCESIGVIYAVNKESADKQEQRILRKRKQEA